jgi:ABC-type glycerol-3-phosphate transport system substrate-binding protein
LIHDQVISSLPAAAQNRTTPDLHFLWNGIYHIEHAWNGLLFPLEDFFPSAQVAAMTGGAQSRLSGQTFRAAWYLIPVMWVVNLQKLEIAGVASLPTNWDELVEACEQLRGAGINPIVVGDGEGDFSVWWLTHLLTQTFDLGTDVADLALGRRSWAEPRHARAWQELHRFVDAGWVDRSALSLTLWDAFARFCAGDGAFTLASGPMFVECHRRLGERVAMMPAPRIDDGRLAGRPIVDSQGLGIPTHAVSPAAGAALLADLVSPSAGASLHERVGLQPPGAAPPGSAPYVPNLLPLALHFDVCAQVGQLVIAGELASAAAGDEADRRCAGWRNADLDRVSLYESWIGDVRAFEMAEVSQ